MKRLALVSLPIFSLCMPAFGADLGPYYSERDTVVERPPPPRVVERERIIERHYYEPAPVYRERRVYVETPGYAYAPRIYAPDVYYDRPHSYAYAGWRPHFFFRRGPFWHRHYRSW